MAEERSASRVWLRALEAVKDIDGETSQTFGSVLDQLAACHGEAPALIDERGVLTYRRLAARTNQYARWAQSQGLAPGTAIGLLMPNCAEYLAAWAGLSHIGCVVALLNTNLSGAALIHAIRTAGCRHLIVDATFRDTVVAIADALEGVRLWAHGMAASGAWSRLDRALARSSEARFDDWNGERPRGNQRALLIYTSGTTGLPKAANVSHARILQWSHWFAGLMDTCPADRLYDCLPMYHSTGGISAIGSVLVRGGAVVIRRGFSARRFWDDVADNGCTIFQYIGEICRYLLQAPPHPRETQHSLRLCCGNGLRAEVWRSFQARFGIPRILEFYAATEGAVSLYNCEGRPGAIGRVPAFLAHRFPLAIARCDPDSGQLVRNADGFCVPCAPNEPGEALGRLDPESRSPARRFEGYTNSGLSERKIARNVFRTGDIWYRTGDLMWRDSEGFVYFLDRLGDAFRWKGENVSASEVAAVIATCAGVVDAVVFGVRIPGTEGRAGMTALAIRKGFRLDELRRHVHKCLPAYARPVFVRLRQRIERTGTFKLSASALARDGYRSVTHEELWFDHPERQAYVRCSASLLDQIESGGLRI